MPKGYWIVRADITDPEVYKTYQAANAAPFKRFGARFLVRAGGFEVVEGSSRARHVVLEFPSYEAALACWNSPEYKSAKAKRQGGAVADIIVIEGYDGAQPGEG